MSAPLLAEIVGHFPDGESFTVARINGNYIPGIVAKERAVAADGGHITIRVRGTEYLPAAWIAYIAGVLDTCSPMEVAS